MIPVEWILGQKDGWVHINPQLISDDDVHNYESTEYWAPTRSMVYLATLLARNPSFARRAAEKGYIYKIELDEPSENVRALQVTEPSLIEKILTNYLANNTPSSDQKHETQTGHT